MCASTGPSRELQPAIIFIDEVDSVLSKRKENENEASRRLKTELLVAFDGVCAGADERILVMGATNLPHEIDEAGLRRFTKRIYVPMPDAKAREAIVKYLLRKVDSGMAGRDIAKVVRMTNGYSGSDLTALLKDAALGPIRELGPRLKDIPADQIRPVSVADFSAALANIRPSTSPESLAAFEAWAKEHGSV